MIAEGGLSDELVLHAFVKRKDGVRLLGLVAGLEMGDCVLVHKEVIAKYIEQLIEKDHKYRCDASIDGYFQKRDVDEELKGVQIVNELRGLSGQAFKLTERVRYYFFKDEHGNGGSLGVARADGLALDRFLQRLLVEASPLRVEEDRQPVKRDQLDHGDAAVLVEPAQELTKQLPSCLWFQVKVPFHQEVDALIKRKE